MIVSPTSENIIRAAKLLSQGQVVAIPTETVYGLAADALNHKAVHKIFSIKGRPSNNPLIVHVDTLEKIEPISTVFDWPMLTQRLERLSVYWPGPLSIVVPKRSIIPDVVSAGLDTIAIRIPKHPVALELLNVCGRPIAAPSANRSNYISPTTAEHVYSEHGDKIPLILNGGDCAVGLESTVVSVIGKVPEILRPGAITREQIELALNEKVSYTQKAISSARPMHSPGMSRLHYAPKTRLEFINKIDLETIPDRTGLISFSAKDMASNPKITITRCLSPEGNLERIAQLLFATLREYDQMQLNLILIDNCSADGLGTAIMDRLMRATYEQCAV